MRSSPATVGGRHPRQTGEKREQRQRRGRGPGRSGQAQQHRDRREQNRGRDARPACALSALKHREPQADEQ